MQFLVRVLWFLLVGWWFAFLWGLVAWLCCASFVLAPLGASMLNRIPWALTLKPAVDDPWTGRPVPELSWWLRAAWFVFVGWWLGLLAFKAGYLCCLSIVGMPLGIWILHRVPLLTTLKQAA